MTGPQHYREDERLARRTADLLAAQVHATLADTAASVEQAAMTALAHDIRSQVIDEWSTAIGETGVSR